MTMTDSARMRGLTARARAMILRPRSEWEAIAGEPADVRGLYLKYVVYLAAIPPVCAFIGQLLFAGGLWRATRVSPVGLLVSAILDYAFTLAAVYVLGLIIDGIAPFFGARRDRIQAMKVAAFFPTAWWLAGVFALVPMLAPLRLLGLFSLFVLWLGLPRLMRAPEDKALLYTLSVVVCAIVLAMLVSIVVGFAAVSMLPAAAAA